MGNYLSLKWGSLKSWDFEGNQTAIDLMKKYCEIGSSVSVMAQNDTPEQKEIICQIIDSMPGDIYLDWDGIFVSKEDAKKHVMEYNQNK